MLLRRFDLDDKQAGIKLKFDKPKHLTTWEHYYNCYNYTIEKIFNKGFQGSYTFNSKSRGILFLIRQSFELCIKHNIELNELKIPNSHDFNQLYLAFNGKNIIPQEFKDVIEKINFDSDGTCYRYYQEKESGKPYFTFNNRIELAELIKDYASIPSSSKFIKGNICEVFDYVDRRKIWDLTFHMGECTGLGQIRTQYDEVIEFLIEGILFDGYDINKIYLPLLFLIRHSLELALKFNLLKAAKISTLVPAKEYDNMHSLAQLYNCFGGEDGFLSRVNVAQMPDLTKKQYELYKQQYQELNGAIHDLDINSMYFRFPVDIKGKKHSLNLKSYGIIKILRLYYMTDPFITFTVDVLEQEGIV